MTDFTEVREQIRAAQKIHRVEAEMIRGALVPYYRRGEMSIPAFKMKAGGDPEKDARETSLKLMGKAATLPVDFFFYDLEDASPDNPEFKPFARRFVIEAFQALQFGDRVRAFRPNNIRTAYFEDDLVEVVGAIGDKLDAIVLPKSENAEEVADVQKALRAIQKAAGRDNRIAIEVLIESPKAFTQIDRIAALDDVSALIFGAWDFARTIGGRVEPETWLADQGTARQTLPIVAAAYGKDAVDAVTATLAHPRQGPGRHRRRRAPPPGPGAGPRRRRRGEAHRLRRQVDPPPRPDRAHPGGLDPGAKAWPRRR